MASKMTLLLCLIEVYGKRATHYNIIKNQI
jgi:hypothetical protein